MSAVTHGLLNLRKRKHISNDKLALNLTVRLCFEWNTFPNKCDIILYVIWQNINTTIHYEQVYFNGWFHSCWRYAGGTKLNTIFDYSVVHTIIPHICLYMWLMDFHIGMHRAWESWFCTRHHHLDSMLINKAERLNENMFAFLEFRVFFAIAHYYSNIIIIIIIGMDAK